MNKKDLLFGAIALSVIGLFVFLSINRTPVPALVARPEHTGVSKPSPDDQDDILKHNKACLVCHALDSEIAPMPQNHPKKGKLDDQRTPCTECHKLPASDITQLIPTKKREGYLLWLNQQQR
jgi:hypothetical protein